MNVHEYQAKQLFADAGVTVPNGTVAQSADQIEQALASFPPNQAVVVKAQIHAGGRGKGTFTNGFQGGVHVVSSSAEAREKAEAMLGNILVTKQTVLRPSMRVTSLGSGKLLNSRFLQCMYLLEIDSM
mgnify:CR=1 FL=1